MSWWGREKEEKEQGNREGGVLPRPAVELARVIVSDRAETVVEGGGLCLSACQQR